MVFKDSGNSDDSDEDLRHRHKKEKKRPKKLKRRKEESSDSDNYHERVGIVFLHISNFCCNFVKCWFLCSASALTQYQHEATSRISCLRNVNQKITQVSLL